MGMIDAGMIGALVMLALSPREQSIRFTGLVIAVGVWASLRLLEKALG